MCFLTGSNVILAQAIQSPYNSLKWTLLSVVALLVLLIYIVGRKLMMAYKIKYEVSLKKGTLSSIIGIGFLNSILSGKQAFAEGTEEIITKAPAQPLPIEIWVLIIVSSVLLIILGVLGMLYNKTIKEARRASSSKEINAIRKELEKEEAEIRGFDWKEMVGKLTGKNTEEELLALDLQHDYDGIRELNNKVPAWWQASFFGTFVIGIIYLFRMFVTGSLPDQITELEREQAIAERRIAAYLKNSANNVDENTVVYLSSAGDLEQGSTLYAKNCVACHGAAGEGTIGPNLTDEYWLHKGDIKDVFYSIKYGWPEKGMKSWANDFSPMQIAQIASYIKSLEGTNPPNAKAPEGEKYP